MCVPLPVFWPGFCRMFCQVWGCLPENQQTYPEVHIYSAETRFVGITKPKKVRFVDVFRFRTGSTNLIRSTLASYQGFPTNYFRFVGLVIGTPLRHLGLLMGFSDILGLSVAGWSQGGVLDLHLNPERVYNGGTSWACLHRARL